jgi:hypothetical protein
MEILTKHQKLVKVFFGLFIFNCVITIFKADYAFGQFLFEKGF